MIIGVKYHSITKRCWIDNDLKYTWAGNSYVLVPSKRLIRPLYSIGIGIGVLLF
jgi:hypothetical protein